MKFRDFLRRDAVVYDMQATDKRAALEELVEALAAVKAVKKSDAPAIVSALVKRENLGSTGIGRGVAVPHARIDCIRKVVGALGRSEAGVPFNALDGKPVHVLFLMLSSPDNTADHLAALERVARILKDETFCRFLRQARGQEDLLDLIDEADQDEESR